MKKTNRILKEVYLESGMSVKEFAIECDVCKSQIYRWLNGNDEVRYSTLERVLKSYGLDVSIKVE